MQITWNWWQKFVNVQNCFVDEPVELSDTKELIFDKIKIDNANVPSFLFLFSRVCCRIRTVWREVSMILVKIRGNEGRWTCLWRFRKWQFSDSDLGGCCADKSQSWGKLVVTHFSVTFDGMVSYSFNYGFRNLLKKPVQMSCIFGSTFCCKFYEIKTILILFIYYLMFGIFLSIIF